MSLSTNRGSSLQLRNAIGSFCTVPRLSAGKRAAAFRYRGLHSTASMMSEVSFSSFPNIIDGTTRSAIKTYQAVDPSTKKQLWDVPIATGDDVGDAVAAAKRAFPGWSRSSQQERVKMINAWMEDLMSHEKEFTEILMRESGKPRFLAGFEISTSKSYVDYHASLKLPEDRYEDDEKIIETKYVPHGVTAAITPWNFPLILTAGKVGPALTAGNTMIVKPSPYTPYSVAKWVEIAQKHLPPGVLQVLNGESSLGPILVDHPDISKISFTGSIPTGKRIMAAAAKTLKHVTLELGGNDPAIVLPDVDIEKVAPEVVFGSFFNTGQMCVSSKRLYVHRDIYKPFLKAMADTVHNLKVGPATEDGVIIGPCQNEAQFHQIEKLVKESVERGDRFATGSASVPSTSGFFIPPTIIDNPPNNARLIREEAFGPIAPVQPWSDVDELLNRVNDTNTGLASSVWSKDISKAKEIGSRIEAGSVFINSWAKLVPQGVLAGRKESGIGGEWGPHGLQPWSTAQTTHIYK